MEKQKIISLIKSLNLPLDDMAVFGSGPICVRGWRDLKDIDLIARENVYEMAKGMGEMMETVSETEGVRIVRDEAEIEIFKHWTPGEWNVDELIDSADVIDGVRFVTLKNVMKWKRLLGRDKDQSDVELIEKELKKSGQKIWY